MDLEMKEERSPKVARSCKIDQGIWNELMTLKGLLVSTMGIELSTNYLIELCISRGTKGLFEEWSHLEAERLG